MRLRVFFGATLVLTVGGLIRAGADDGMRVHGRPTPGGGGVQPLLSPIPLIDTGDGFSHPIADGGLPPIGDIGGYGGGLGGPVSGAPASGLSAPGGPDVPKVPEPGTASLLALGAGLLGLLRRSYRRR